MEDLMKKNLVRTATIVGGISRTLAMTSAPYQVWTRNDNARLVLISGHQSEQMAQGRFDMILNTARITPLALVQSETKAILRLVGNLSIRGEWRVGMVRLTDLEKQLVEAIAASRFPIGHAFTLEDVLVPTPPLRNLWARLCSLGFMIKTRDGTRFLTTQKLRDVIEGMQMNRMQKKLRDEWVAALRNSYRQGFHLKARTGSGAEEFTAIGVLCDLIDPGAWKVNGEFFTSTTFSFEGENTLPERYRDMFMIPRSAIEQIEQMTEHNHDFRDIAIWIETSL
jgi:hypothetical protein